MVSSVKDMTMVGTPNYIDPRVIRGERYEELCDVFSFGIILAECLYEKRIDKMVQIAPSSLHVQGKRVDLPKSRHDYNVSLLFFLETRPRVA